MQFEKLEQSEFDRVVEALLLAEAKAGELRAQVLDGRGGDGGIDVGVWNNAGHLVHIYQLKYFPQGFSGLFSKRRSQISDSFDTAWKTHQPPKWTLVIPRNPSREEQAYVLRLAEGKHVQVDIMGQAGLDLLLGKHRHVHERFFTDKTVEYLRAINRPEEALTQSSDIGVVMQRVFERYLIRSSYWASTIHMDADGQVRETLVARTPDAHLREPLTATLTTQFDEGSRALKDQFVRGLRFGFAEDVDLPASVIKGFVRRGAPWFDSDDPIGRMQLFPLDEWSDTPVELVAETDTGNRITAISGRVKRFTRGQDGAQLVAAFDGGLETTWLLPLVAGEESVTLRISSSDLPVRDVRLVAKFLSALPDAGRVRIRVNGEDLVVFTLNGGDMGYRPGAEFLSLLDDLFAIENEFDVKFVCPSGEVTESDRLWAAALRQVIAGVAVPMPDIDSFTMTLAGTYDDQLVGLLRGDGCALLAQQADFGVDIMGVHVHVGHVFIFQRRGVFEDGAAHADALVAGAGENRKVRVFGKDGLPWVLYQPQRRSENDNPIPVTGWGVAGIPEHPGLSALQQAQTNDTVIPLAGPSRAVTPA